MLKSRSLFGTKLPLLILIVALLSLTIGYVVIIKDDTLSKQELEGIFTKLNAGHLKILNIQMSPVKGLWEVTISDKGQMGIVYIDIAKKHLISGPIIPIEERTVNREPEALNQQLVDVSKISLEDAIIMGDKLAPIRVIMFTDPGCSFCARLHQEMEAVILHRRDIAFYIKFFPIMKHTEEQIKSIVCSGSLSMLKDVYAQRQTDILDCAETINLHDMRELAQSLGISVVPTLIMPDGRVHVGFVKADALINIIDGRT